MARGTNVGDIFLNLGINKSGFSKEMNNMDGLVKSSVGKLAKAAAAAFTAKKIFDIGKQAVEVSSDLQEVQNVVDTAFGNMSYKMEQFADSAVKSFGMSRLSAKQTGSTFMAMAKGMDLPAEKASDMAVNLTGLSGDIASFYNISQDLASTKLKSVFTGETETLKDLGIVMTQTNLKQFALSKGITKNIDDMTQAELVQLRYAFIMKQTALAQGDFAKTQGSWANQTRILQEQWKEFLGILGNGLTQVLTPMIQALNSIVGKLITLGNAASKVFSEMFGGKQAEENTQNTANAIADVGDSTASASKKIKKSLAGFDELNKLTNGTADSSSAISDMLGDVGVYDLSKNTKNQTDLISKNFEQFFRKLADAMQPTINAFKSLWNDGLSLLGKFEFENLKLFYNNFLVPVGKWVMGQGLPQFFDTVNDGLKQMNFDNLNKSFSEFYTQCSRFTVALFQGLFEFVDKFLKPISVWTVNTAIPSFLDAVSSAVARINFDIVTDALGRFFSQLASFTIDVGSGLMYILNNILVPLAAWTISDLLPTFLDLLSSAFKVLQSAWEALAPSAADLFDNLLIPLAKWTGSVIIGALQTLIGLFNKLSNWIQNNQAAFSIMTEIVGGFFLAWKANELMQKSQIIVKSVNVVKDVIKNFDVVIGLLKENVASLLNPTNLMIAAFAILGTGILELIKNWDKMSGLSKAVTIFSAVAGAAAAAAVAIGIFHTTWSVGVAAAAIAAGIALIAGTQASIKKATDTGTYTSVPKFAKGGIVTQPTLAMVGERGKEAVMPLENNTGWIDNLANQLAGKIGGSTQSSGSTNATVILELNGTELGRAVINSINEYQRQTGVIMV